MRRLISDGGSRARTDRSAVIDAALRRIERRWLGPPTEPRLAPRPPAPLPAPAAEGRGRREPVVRLDPPRRDAAAAADPRALAALLADDIAARLDQLCYVWDLVSQLEPFGRPGEPSLRRRAAELFVVASGGRAEVPIEGPLRAARHFLAAHGLGEDYVERLCRWYLDRRGA